jgi:hypothetical protein
MSRVHDAMRNLEQKTAPEKDSVAISNNLVGALIGELADEVPDDPNLESVRADLLSASRSYEHDKKKDLALRFYLAMRSVFSAHEALQERLKKAEKRNRAVEFGTIEKSEEPSAEPQSDRAAHHG